MHVTGVQQNGEGCPDASKTRGKKRRNKKMKPREKNGGRKSRNGQKNITAAENEDWVGEGVSTLPFLVNLEQKEKLGWKRKSRRVEEAGERGGRNKKYGNARQRGVASLDAPRVRRHHGPLETKTEGLPLRSSPVREERKVEPEVPRWRSVLGTSGRV